MEPKKKVSIHPAHAYVLLPMLWACPVPLCLRLFWCLSGSENQAFQRTIFSNNNHICISLKFYHYMSFFSFFFLKTRVVPCADSVDGKNYDNRVQPWQRNTVILLLAVRFMLAVFLYCFRLLCLSCWMTYGSSVWLHLTDPFPAIKRTVSQPFQIR